MVLFIVPPNSTSNSAKTSSNNTIFLQGFGTIRGSTIRGTIFIAEEFSLAKGTPSQHCHCRRTAATSAAALPPPPPPCCRHHHRRRWCPCPLSSPLSLRSLAPAPSAAVAFVYIIIVLASLLPFPLPLQVLLLVDCWLFVPPPPPPPCCRRHRHAATAVTAPALHRQAAAAATAANPPYIVAGQSINPHTHGGKWHHHGSGVFWMINEVVDHLSVWFLLSK